MRAVIIATGYHKTLKPLVNECPSPLFKIVDKPIIFHIIEHLVKSNIRQFDLILHHLPEQVEAVMEDGKRWGVEINCHLVKDDTRPYNLIKTLCSQWQEEPVLLGLGDAMPELPELSKLKPQSFVDHENKWTGWGIFTKEFLVNLTKDAIPEQETTTPVNPFISTQTLFDLKESNIRLLQEKLIIPLFPATASKVEPGIWISRAVIIEPGAQITAPVFIGENSHIKSNAWIGPNTVIENHSIIDSGSHIKGSLVCQNSYVGENLEISQCIIDGNRLINLELQTTIQITDDFILSATTPPSIYHHLAVFFEKTFAGLLLFFLSPLYLYMLFTSSQEKRACVRLPLGKESFFLTTFANSRYLSTLPFLIPILKGDLHFVGVPPRSEAEVKQLSKEWRSLYLSSKPGWITLADVEYQKTPTSDELYASEAFYFTHSNAWFDFKIISRWLLSLFLNSKKVPNALKK